MSLATGNLAALVGMPFVTVVGGLGLAHQIEERLAGRFAVGIPIFHHDGLVGVVLANGSGYGEP